MKDHTIKYLVDKLHEAGIIRRYKNYRSARQTVQSWITSGRLQLRQDDRNNYYLVNEKEVEQIIRAFRWQGEGFWHAEL